MADIFRVPKKDNYTIISNTHFKDQRLSLRAKGLLSMILSLPDNWDLTLKGLVKICTEGRDAVNNTLKELQSFGYVRKYQSRGKTGKLGKVVYEIYEKPADPPLPENPFAVENGLAPDVPPLPEKPLTDNPFTAEPLTVNPTQLSTKEIKNEMNKDIHQSIQTRVLNSRDDFFLDRETAIKQNIEYDILIDRYDIKEVDELVRLMSDTVSCLNPTLKVGGQEYPSKTVITRFLSLEFEHIEFVLDQFMVQAAKRKITNVHGYLLAMLFNAPTAMEHYYTALLEQTTQI